MNARSAIPSPIIPGYNPSPPSRSGILDTVRTLRLTTRSELSDVELTHLLRSRGTLSEEGFAFACFSEGCVTLNVPPQDPNTWCAASGRIAPDKETVARKLAEHCGLSLSEPPDAVATWGCIGAAATAHHHHLVLFNRWDTVVVAHPCYVKIRLFGRAAGARCGPAGQAPLELPADLLHEIAALYRS